MDIHELKQFESVYQPSKEIAFCWLRKQYVQLSTEENHAEVVDHANDSLRIWQTAKAQAVPDGFVVVPMVPSERMINTVRQCYEGEAYLPYSLYSEFVNQAIIERMEAQEPAND